MNSTDGKDGAQMESDPKPQTTKSELPCVQRWLARMDGSARLEVTDGLLDMGLFIPNQT
ncbi:MAG: hypothetical protein ABL921_14210 [Pirellula sp.]